ncbi:N-acetyltransferase [Nocardiopsis gilva YIM 90087]|uniref:N-acetyltransferase n=1 Tax=Nocardiopsis gilva YIM 90087 TaxID=1235441 RepID=A0A223S178_9ACTN|nr:GNAT family N-acetyltransferase [Nocardiopsis gilva]ASU81847.1 N-acetyltransferase [Nocardiopsis gilva YIM 90087]
MHQQKRLDRLNARLCASPAFCPVGVGEGRRFRRWELASFCELAFEEFLDPRTMTSGEQQQRVGNLRDRNLWECDEDDFATRYWLVTEGGVVGTLGVGTHVVGFDSVRLQSLYVHPGVRRSGIASRVLETVYNAAIAEGLGGIHLETHWAWQDSLKFYLGRGLRVANWKHGIALARDRRFPHHTFHSDQDKTTLLVEHDGAMRPLVAAERDGTRLLLQETDLQRELAASDTGWSVLLHGKATLALRLAMDGWPLVRSQEAWKEAPLHSDIGAPEGLAYKIKIFEEAARGDGWRVDTPDIPGLSALPTN